MNIEPLVSIVVPYYKTREDIISCCIKSVISQTYNNIEILIIDDGSGDEYSQIINNLKNFDERINIIRKETNGGLSAARNTGLLLSKGEYVLFVDSDDLINCSTLQNMILLISESKTDMVIGELKVITDYGTANYLKKNNVYFENIDGIEALEKLVTNRGFGSTACGRLASRNLWLSNGDKPFIEGILHEDLASMWKIVKNCQRITFLMGDYYYYFQGGESDIHKHKASIKFCEDFYSALTFRNEHLRKELPSLNEAIDYSYLVYIPLIYMYIIDSENPIKLQPLKNRIQRQYHDSYKNGNNYKKIRIKNKIKFVVFKWFPLGYVRLYMTIRKIMKCRN